MMRHRLAMLLRRLADRLEPQDSFVYSTSWINAELERYWSKPHYELYDRPTEDQIKRAVETLNRYADKAKRDA